MMPAVFRSLLYAAERRVVLQARFSCYWTLYTFSYVLSVLTICALASCSQFKCFPLQAGSCLSKVHALANGSLRLQPLRATASESTGILRGVSGRNATFASAAVAEEKQASRLHAHSLAHTCLALYQRTKILGCRTISTKLYCSYICVL